MNPKSINIAVAEQVEKLGSDKVITTVVDKLVNTEVIKRAECSAEAIKLAESNFNELRKASKADQVAISVDGIKTESFSPKAFETKKKLEEKLAKIDTVVINATEKGEWGKLYELVKGSGGQPSSTTETKSDDAA